MTTNNPHISPMRVAMIEALETYASLADEASKAHTELTHWARRLIVDALKVGSTDAIRASTEHIRSTLSFLAKGEKDPPIHDITNIKSSEIPFGSIPISEELSMFLALLRNSGAPSLDTDSFTQKIVEALGVEISNEPNLSIVMGSQRLVFESVDAKKTVEQWAHGRELLPDGGVFAFGRVDNDLSITGKRLRVLPLSGHTPLKRAGDNISITSLLSESGHCDPSTLILHYLDRNIDGQSVRTIQIYNPDLVDCNNLEESITRAHIGEVRICQGHRPSNSCCPSCVKAFGRFHAVDEVFNENERLSIERIREGHSLPQPVKIVTTDLEKIFQALEKCGVLIRPSVKEEVKNRWNIMKCNGIELRTHSVGMGAGKLHIVTTCRFLVDSDKVDKYPAFLIVHASDDSHFREGGHMLTPSLGTFALGLTPKETIARKIVKSTTLNISENWLSSRRKGANPNQPAIPFNYRTPRWIIYREQLNGRSVDGFTRPTGGTKTFLLDKATQNDFEIKRKRNYLLEPFEQENNTSLVRGVRLVPQGSDAYLPIEEFVFSVNGSLIPIERTSGNEHSDKLYKSSQTLIEYLRSVGALVPDHTLEISIHPDPFRPTTHVRWTVRHNALKEADHKAYKPMQGSFAPKSSSISLSDNEIINLVMTPPLNEALSLAVPRLIGINARKGIIGIFFWDASLNKYQCLINELPNDEDREAIRRALIRQIGSLPLNTKEERESSDRMIKLLDKLTKLNVAKVDD